MPRFALLLALALASFAPAAALRTAQSAEEGDPKANENAPDYPAAFRLAVHESISRGLAALGRAQAADGAFAGRDGRGRGLRDQALGRTALPLLALLEGGTAPGEACIVRGLRALHGLPMEQTYSVGLAMMAIHAFYRPALDAHEEAIGQKRSLRVDPRAVFERLSARDRAALERGRDMLVAAQAASGLWSYGIQPAGGMAYDLSNTQYALLGLRAVADCGIDVPAAAWRSALEGLLALQEADGPEVDLVAREHRGGYVFQIQKKARARGFPYVGAPRLDDDDRDRRRRAAPPMDVPVPPSTGSMTTAGVACVAICMEGLWRRRGFSGSARAKAEAALRDGVAWMQTHFSVLENPEMGSSWHLYYLYGLERMGMLLGIRWIGDHDWYREGAETLMGLQQTDGGWGSTVDTAFAVLFLKRATMPVPVLTVGGR